MKDILSIELTRRDMLALMGSASLGMLVGKSRPLAVAAPSCVVRPEQTEGPYFLDSRLHRSDLRVEPSDGSIKSGVPLRLDFNVLRLRGRSCIPLHGAVLHLWQCDALGVYSGVRDLNGGFDASGKQFLRGFQLTDADGRARFSTIYPGWYAGRTVHIHFKIRTGPSSSRNYEFTSQLYFPEDVTAAVQQQAPYHRVTQSRTTNERDFGFRRGGKQLMPVLAEDGQGYTAEFSVALRLA